MILTIKNTALILTDLQNDFILPNGAYGRAGQCATAIADLPYRLKPIKERLHAAGGWVVSTHFTLVPGKKGEPFISAHLKELRPFLGKGDFLPGAPGHALVDELKPVDFSVEKIAFSAFYQTRLEWVLRRAGINTLIVAGIVTNGGVASTVRDAHVRDFRTIVLSDGCAAFSQEVHETSIASLMTVSEIMTCEQLMDTVLH